ncbi:hypothetical protein P153DRAFT_219252 [Dothidotthia symphoricarpi CBS 119687]|uniref:Uncharacterized protein n=1 Tax=Dothidotthia symphoricarpi CBS 119687 TaxID=1392245 RepID=A0A6A6AJ81_9PLEO|nr:uncharacterized protein P153DRAFT_219252 [Dothidotthia symphoricarpi CBS 119687]KAF2130491.1 hypothetical protein P153DRAFT_219252 [Dothidotthia symphoricarpi CBS 119687]
MHNFVPWHLSLNVVCRCYLFLWYAHLYRDRGYLCGSTDLFIPRHHNLSSSKHPPLNTLMSPLAHPLLIFSCQRTDRPIHLPTLQRQPSFNHARNDLHFKNTHKHGIKVAASVFGKVRVDALTLTLVFVCVAKFANSVVFGRKGGAGKDDEFAQIMGEFARIWRETGRK